MTAIAVCKFSPRKKLFLSEKRHGIAVAKAGGETLTINEELQQ
jgi:hypothetical protein